MSKFSTHKKSNRQKQEAGDQCRSDSALSSRRLAWGLGCCGLAGCGDEANKRQKTTGACTADAAAAATAAACSRCSSAAVASNIRGHSIRDVETYAVKAAHAVVHAVVHKRVDLLNVL